MIPIKGRRFMNQGSGLFPTRRVVIWPPGYRLLGLAVGFADVVVTTCGSGASPKFLRNDKLLGAIGIYPRRLVQARYSRDGRALFI